MLTGTQKNSISLACAVVAGAGFVVAALIHSNYHYLTGALLIAPVFYAIRRLVAPEIPEPASSEIRGVLVPAIAGVATGAVAAVFYLSKNEAEPGGGWAFLVLFLVGPPVALVATGILLRVAKTPRPWSTAAAGVVASYLLIFLAGQLADWNVPLLLMLAIGTGYTWAAVANGTVMPIAARLTASGALIIAFLSFAPATSAIQDAKQDKRLAEQLSTLTIPLKMPEVRGFSLTDVQVDEDKGWLLLTLTDATRSSIGVLVLPLPHDFSPPDQCGPAYTYFVTQTAPCREAEPRLWSRDSNGRNQYLRKAGPTLALAEGSSGIPAEKVREAAMSMRDTTVDELTALT